MSCRLAVADGVEASLLAGRDDYARARPHLPAALADLPVAYLPDAGRMTRALLLVTDWLPVERWSEAVDWVYCPKEQPLATRDARLAATVHDVLPLEPGVPGMPADASPWKRARWRLLLQRLLKRADLIATVSEFTQRRLVDLLGVDERRIVVVGNGVAPGYFRETSDNDALVLERFRQKREQYVMVVGSLTYRKGGDIVLSAARELQRSNSPLRIAVTGRRHDAALVAQLADMKRDCPELPIDLLGYVSQLEQAALLSNCAALLFPSRYEGFGIPALEAMAAGAPVICSRRAALPEVVGDAAIPLEGESTAEVLEAVRHASDSTNGRADLIAAGRRRAAEFTWDRCAGRLLSAMTTR
jgi:glycosyltransferase involved in cell wall biosynthesis